MIRSLAPHALRRAALVAAAGTAIALAAGLVWWLSLGASLAALEAKGRSDLRLASDRLRLEVQRARDLAVFLASDPRLPLWLAEAEPQADETVRATLVALADRSGAADLWLLDPAGRTIVGTESAPRLVSAPWVARMRQGGLGLGLDPPGNAMIHAAPVFGPDGRVLGGVAATTSLLDVERSWRGDPLTIYFTDEAGRVILSNRGELRAIPPQGAQPSAFGGGRDLRRIDAGSYVPALALHLDWLVVTLGVRGHVLLDTAPARALAFTRALAAAAVMTVLAGAMAFLWDRRRRLARANALLEDRVAERTAELSAEIRERREAEEALKRAQAELVQAGKLSALGQMSAGISHELNQPLMAMRSFAQNATTFLDRDRPDRTRDNLSRIDALADRMGRIIRNLSAFARAETRPAVVTDLREVIEMALEVTGPRRAQVETVLDLVPGPVLAMGGETRLAQVVANLVANAVDAMAGAPGARLTIALADGPPRITVADTGPGLDDPDAIFDPFYTTKAVGEGLGLGLSISYGIVSGFGGTIRGRNTGAGAEFTIELRPASGADAQGEAA